MANDLKNMTRKQLEKLQKDVQKALITLENREKREAKKAAEAAVAKFGFKLKDITSPASISDTQSSAPKRAAKKTAGVPKYANPANPSQTWTGKGRQPNWYRAEVEKGTDIATMEI